MRKIVCVVWIVVAVAGVALSQQPASTARQERSETKSLFLVEAKYADSSWAAMSEKPQNRRELLQAAVKTLGGSVENFWFSFAACDAYVVISLPDNISAEALQIAGMAGGGFKSVRTIPLLTVDQQMEAAAKAGAFRNSTNYKAAHKALEH